MSLEASLDRNPPRLAAALLLGGQLLFIVVTRFHPDGDANNHRVVFEEYARSEIWTAVHVAQFAAMVILLGGLLAVFYAFEFDARTARWAGRFGVVAATATLALYAALQAVDEVALKQAVAAWALAPAAEKAARFASAETIRWLEWGVRSYQNFALGVTLLLFAVAIGTLRSIPRPIAVGMALSGLTHLAQGWIGGSQGFSRAHTIAIVLGFALNLGWMTWLLVFSWRTQGGSRPELE